MRKKRIYLALVILIFGIIAALYFHNLSTKSVEQTVSMPSVHDKDELRTEKPTKDSHQKSQEAEKKDNKKKILAQLLKNPHLKKMNDLIDASNESIEFYGKVVDQYGEPVPGVKVLLSAGRSYGIGASYIYTRYTDEFGMFNTEGMEGFAFGVRAFEKEGYDIKKYGIVNGKKRGSFRSHREEDTGHLAWTDYTKDNPFIYHAWKKGEAAELIKGESLLGFKPDGRVYTLDLMQKDKLGRIIISEGRSEGDIRIAFSRPEDANFHNNFDWSVSIEAVDGGLIETEDLFMYEAPMDGYDSRWTLNRNKNDSDWKSEEKKKFYLKSRNGANYGWLEVELKPIYRKHSAMRIYYWINPNGSRNLQYDKNKEIVIKRSKRVNAILRD